MLSDLVVAQIPENLKRRYQLHRLVRFNFPTFTALAYCLTLNYLGMDNLYLVVLSAIVCTLLFLILKRKYSNLFIKNPEKSNTIFVVENFATFALISYSKHSNPENSKPILYTSKPKTTA